ncbi:MAG: VWA domain-containing protein [Rhizobiaceae bacterium]
MAKSKVPVPGTKKSGNSSLVGTSSPAELAVFLESARKLDPRSGGRLIFALDATMSRQPAWDRAMQHQAAMFDAVARIGTLAVQLVYFRGFGECRASRWVLDGGSLGALMTGIECRGGMTQIAKVLSHGIKENARAKVAALVFIGDAVEEDVDRLCHLAGELAVSGTRIFLFQDGHDSVAEKAFREMARLSRGAWFRLGDSSAGDLAELLSVIAVYASGGRDALVQDKSRASRLLLEQMNRRGGS